ncbi:MAG: hypothetical protein U0575_08350 [Phycisphaerales bacterium]
MGRTDGGRERRATSTARRDTTETSGNADLGVHPPHASLRLRAATLLRHPAVRVAGALIGVALLGAALATVFMRRELLDEAWKALARPNPKLAATLVLAILGNLLCTAMVFLALLSRFGRVRPGEMIELIAASTLLNFVPMRPGLFGRIAWHRAVNGIPAMNTARTIVESIGLSATCVALLATGLLVGHGLALAPPLELACGLGAPLLAPLAAVAIRPLRPFAVAAFFRVLDLHLWGLRYGVAFVMIGSPVPAEAAMALAASSTAASLVPLAGNGLGLREWTTAMLAPLLANVDMHLAITAELVNRAAEIAVVVPAGLLSIAALVRRRRAMRKGEDGEGMAAGEQG